MSLLNKIYTQEIMEIYKIEEHYSKENLFKVDESIIKIIDEIPCIRFYNLFSSLTSKCTLALNLENENLLPSKKLYRIDKMFDTKYANNVVSFIDYILKADKYNIDSIREEMRLNIVSMNDKLERSILTMNLFDNNNSCKLDINNDFEIDQEDSNEEIENKLDGYMSKRIKTEEYINKYVYKTLGWGSLILNTNIFDRNIIELLETKYQMAICPQ